MTDRETRLAENLTHYTVVPACCPECDGVHWVSCGPQEYVCYFCLLERERDELRDALLAAETKLQALELMLTAETWGAAYGAVCEDYPELVAMVNKYHAIVRRKAGGQ